MSQEIKTLSKVTTILREFAFIIGIIITVTGAYYRLQGSVKDTNTLVNQIVKDMSEIQEQVKENSRMTTDNSTSIKVIETQYQLLKGNQ